MNIDALFDFKNREQARRLQTILSSRVRTIEDSEFRPRLICGMDVSYDREVAHAAAAVWDMKSHEFVERTHSKGNASIGYFPGLLGFREGPLIVALSRKLRSGPDVFLIDGQGFAHPRRFGLACQFGVAVDQPTIGVAKSRLYGRLEHDMILDPDGNKIGRVVTSLHAKKFYVSIGHRISLDGASRIVESTFVNGHPAPLRQAHLDSISLKRNGSV